jgi:type I restriction enzyme S subunit
MDWKEYPFGDLVDFPPRVPLRKGDSYTFVDMSAITPFSRFVASAEHKLFDGSSHSRFVDGDVLMARITPCLENGKVAQFKSVSGEKGFGSTEFFVFRPKPEKLDGDFLYYLSRSDLLWKSAINSMVGASGRQRADAKFLKRVLLKLPSLAVQRKIAAILTAYDDLIEVNKRRIVLLEKMAEEIYREWFVRMRFPGHQDTRFVKGVPKGWNVEPISTIGSEIRSGVKKKDLADDEIYIGLEHIPRKSIAFKEWATADSIDSNKLHFKERDILFSKIRPYLHKVGLAHFSGACSSDTIVLRPRHQVYEGFLLFTVFSDTFIELATTASKGTKMPRADWAFLEKLEIKIPSLDLLEKYQARFEEIFNMIATLLRANQQAVNAHGLLLPRLISGKLSVADLDIQFPPSMQEASSRTEVEPGASYA